jgi:hypothetical protein
MKLSPIQWILIIGLTLAILLTVMLYPATAVYNPKTGTLKLTARFRSHFFHLKEYIGKKEQVKIGPVTFIVDYKTKGLISYKIIENNGGAILLTGKETYKFNELVNGNLPNEIVVASTVEGNPNEKFSLN